MSRRKRADDDSLELLLDTICNMFGGVIFIAILMALMAGGRRDAGAAAAPNAPSRASIVAAEVRRLEGLVQRAEETALIAEEGVDAMEATLESIEEQVAAAKDRLGRLRETQERLAEKSKGAHELEGSAAARLAELREEAKRLAELIEQEISARRSDARLPVKHRSNLIGFPVIVRGNRLYEVYLAGSADERRFNATDVAWEPQNDVTLIKPLLGRGGYPVDPALSRSERWKATLSKLDRRKRAFDVALYPDSFEAFHRFREAATRAGFSYNVTLFATTEPVYLVPTDEFPVQ